MRITFEDFLLEFNNQDKQLIKELDDYFTIAIEYEIASTEDPSEEPPIEDQISAIENVKHQTLLDLERGKIIGNYMFSEDKWPKSRFINNEKQMMLDNPDFKKLSEKKKKSLHKKYKTWTWLNELLDELEDLIDFEDQEDTEINLNPKDWTDKFAQVVVKRFALNANTFCFSKNIDYLKAKFKEEMPNFFNKWNKTFKYELEDNGVQRILEFSPKTYCAGISEAIEQLNDFFNEFEEQDIWEINDKTGLHINIGTKENSSWNPLKGILLTADIQRGTKEPYIFKGIEWRLNNRFVGSLIDTILKDFELDEITLDPRGKVVDRTKQRLQSQIDALKEQLPTSEDKEEIKLQIDDLQKAIWNLAFRKPEKILKNKQEFLSSVNLKRIDIQEIEDSFNDYLIKSNANYYQKEFAIKLTEIKNNYVEFRHIGGKAGDKLGGLTEKLVIDKLYYFCYIVYAMTNKEFKRKEYLKKLYKFIDLVRDKISRIK